MRLSIWSTVLASLVAVAAFAGSSVTVTPLRGGLQSLPTNQNGTIEGFFWSPQATTLPGLRANLYHSLRL